MTNPDAVVVGSGPNGLSAAICLAQAGCSVLVLEAKKVIGGGTRSGQLTLPGFIHDICSAVHPMAALSPLFRRLPLQQHGLHWIYPPASVAHPLDGEPAVLLRKSVDETVSQFEVDSASYRRLVGPFLRDGEELFEDVLAPLRIPNHPLRMLQFGLRGVHSAVSVARRFQGDRARALLAGCAAHSILPLDWSFTGAMGLLFLIAGHTLNWPVAMGGSSAIARALSGLLRSLGGRIETGVCARSIADLPAARVYLFDTSPAQLMLIAEPVLPAGYLRRIRGYQYGPAAFKVDWALDGPIPWKDDRCLAASTVHLGGTLEEIAASESAVWKGEHPERPFVLFCQQSEFDRARTPEGGRTGWAYCHIPAGSTLDLTDQIENQVERFAPGFKERILARHVMGPLDLERYNPNYIGGAITGGASNFSQLFARPVARLNPYTTPNPRIFLCSSSTPPGGGVHGMCGYYAARAAQRRLHRFAPTPLR